MDINNSQLTAVVVTAIVGTLGIIKFKLIEELVKKITTDDSKVKPYAIVFLLLVAAAIGLASFLPAATSEVTESKEVVQAETPAPIQKSDLEVKVDAVKQGVELTRDIVGSIKENKQRKDSTFEAEKTERWVVQVGDWTDDDNRILEIHKSLISDNVKLLKIKKLYLFVIEDGLAKDQVEASLDSLPIAIGSLKPRIFNLNEVLTRKKDKLIERFETFGKRKNKVQIKCLVLD